MSINLNSIHVGIIGLGRMGIRHLEVVEKMGMTICGMVDVSATALSEAAQKYNIPDDCCFNDVGKMLLEKKPNAVVIATTAPSHAEYTILCAQNNVKYILCEKPMALSLDEANGMIDACEHFGAKLAINHQMMFLPQYTEIKKIIDSENFGPLSSIVVSGSNFGLAMNASHYFEMFRFLTNSEVATVQAWLEDEKIPNPRGPQFEDYSGSLIARNAMGHRMYIDFSAKAGHGLQVIYIFKYGQIFVDELSGYIRTICRKEEHKDLPTTRYGMPDDVNQYEIEAKQFGVTNSIIEVWKGMLSGSAFPDYNVGLHTMKCLIAAFESQESNNAVIKTDNISIDKMKKFKWA